jgi:glycosyltransferase involved in cell wall biosynthesis
VEKILFIHHATAWGGAPKSLIKLIKSLDKSKYSSLVLLLKKSIICKYLEEEGISYEVASSLFYRKYYHYFAHSEASYCKRYQFYRFFESLLKWLLSRIYFARKELEKYDFDIVHLNSSVLTDWIAPSKKQAKVIIHIREPFRKGKIDILHHIFKRQISKYADHIIAISKDNAERVGIPDKTTVVYNYSEVPNKSPTPESYESKQFLYLGGSASIKGFYTLVKSLDYLDKSIMILFGGSYPVNYDNQNWILTWFKKLLRYGVKKRDAVLKIQNHSQAKIIGASNDVNLHLEQSCCLISPNSVSHFSRPVIEAQLHKKPVIGSDVKGMEEIIKQNISGLIFPVDKPKALAEAINFIAKHPNKAIKMGREGYKVAKKNFTPTNINSIEQIYIDIT